MPSKYTCSYCNEKGYDFNLHKCPALVEPIKGETFDEYRARSKAHARAWRIKKGLEKK